MPSNDHRGAPRQVSLTFDDGPSTATTPRLLDQLRELGVRATFFVVGQNMASSQGFAIVKRTAEEGHQIGNHSYSHVNLTQLTGAQIEKEIKRTENLIGLLDSGVKLFRPPFGFHNALVNQTATDLGYKSVLWNVSSLDWQPRYQNRRWVSHVLRQVQARRSCVVLAHDVLPSTVAHVSELVAAIQEMPETEFALLAQ